MKKLLGILAVTTFVFIGFSCNSAEKAEAEKLKKEIIATDSISMRMETVQDEINLAADKVDQLLYEL